MADDKLMTNRQLSQLCAKGLCEWCYKEEQKVSTDFEYLVSEPDMPVSNQIAIRPFEKMPLTNTDENEWFEPTKEAYTLLIGSDRTRHILGF